MRTQPFYINPYHEQFIDVKLNVLKRTRYKVVPGGAGTRIPGAGSYFDLFNYRAVFHMRCV